MAISELMMEGVDLLVIGMGTVFVFLALLVASVALMSKLAGHIEDLLPAPEETSSASNTGHIAAISAAVKRYRASRGS